MTAEAPHWRARIGLGAVLALSAVATLVVALSSSLRFAYRLPQLHVAIETAAAIICLVAAYLVAGRFQRRRRMDDLALAYALMLFAGSNLIFGAAPAIAGGDTSAFSTWGGVCGRVLGAVALAFAALAPARAVDRVHLPRTAPAIPLVLLVAAAVAVGLMGSSLPLGVQTELSPESSTRPRLVGHPVVLVLQLGAMALFAVAAIGFARRAERDRDEFLAWIAGAVIAGAFARLNYFLYPSLYTEWVYTGDAFRLLFYTAILIGAGREVRSYWRATADAAVLEERRRLARDLHDGLAQELAYVTRNVQRLDREDPAVRRVAAGAARAMMESRRAIAALTERLDRPLDQALAEVAHDVAAREGTHVALDLTPGAVVTPAQREGLVRIVAEAVTNAARHGGAQLVRVRLDACGGGVRVCIADAGRGFDPLRVQPGRFGLISMRERAEALGGQFRLTAAPGGGTQVEVSL